MRIAPRLCFLLIFLLSGRALSQDSGEGDRLLPEGLGLFNQMKYSYDREKKLEIFEDWLNLDYRYRMFSSGLRFETFEPNDPNPSISRGKSRYSDIAFKYIKAEFGNATEGGDITVGNFYVLFGRGLVLKSYEDRNIRVDNNLLGVKVSGRYRGLTLTALSGRVENFLSQRIDALHAFDLEYKPMQQLKVGGSFASNQPEQDGAARTRLASVRIQPSIWNFDFYGEYGIKQNDDIKEQVFHGDEAIAGRAAYASLNFYYESFSLVGEYKHYDNFAFFASDQTVSYNTPPSVRRDYAYILLNRHPSPLNQNNERGFQVESNYILDEATAFNASYGLTRTLSPGSFYQRVLGMKNDAGTQLREAFAQATRTWINELTTTVGFGYAEELATNTKNVTPILDVRYSMDETNTLRVIAEHQHVTDRTTQERYNDDVLTLEYLRSPDITLSTVLEMQTREPVAGTIERNYWAFGQVGFKIADHTDASVLIGSRQAGNICIGGVCRYEPEFKGIELKLMSRF